MRRIALTGGIASGKSLIGDLLTQKGIPVIDADQVVHQLLNEDEPLKAEIAQMTDSSILNEHGQIDRGKLGQLVFQDATLRKTLEAAIHPKVRTRIEYFFEDQARQKAVMAVAIIPLLFESDRKQPYKHQFDEVWLVETDETQQMARLMETRGMSSHAAMARIQSQMPLSEKQHWAKQHPCPRFINNQGSKEQIVEALDTILTSF